MTNILLIEDDYEAADLITLIFEQDDYTVVHADDGSKGLAVLSTFNFDLVLLDITLPDTNGFQICKRIRARDCHTPIIMLTSHAKESDKVLALDLGADDYVTKPLPLLEFKARVKALLRRSSRTSSRVVATTIIRGALELDLQKRTATLLHKRIELTLKEFNLLALLAANPGKIYSRKDLLMEIWGQQYEGYQHTVTTHINRLRTKLEEDSSNPGFVLTSRGSGYHFTEALNPSGR